MGQKILLLDDEIDFTELTGTLLEFHDFQVRTYNDPELMLNELEKEHYDLIVTDLMMPNIDGFEVIKQIKEKEGYKSTPIIVLSAKPLTDEERKFLFKNKVLFLMKPFEPLGLVEEIKQLLSESKEV